MSSSQRADAAAETPSTDAHPNPYALDPSASEPDVYKRMGIFAGRPLWCNSIPPEWEVANGMDQNSKQLQESMFELLTSEASYYKSLDLVVRDFFQQVELVDVITEADKRLLMSNIEQIRDLSKVYVCAHMLKITECCSSTIGQPTCR